MRMGRLKSPISDTHSPFQMVCPENVRQEYIQIRHRHLRRSNGWMGQLW